MRKAEFERCIPWDEETKLHQAHDSLRGLIELCGGDFEIVIDTKKMAAIIGLITDLIGSVVIGFEGNCPVQLDGSSSEKDCSPLAQKVVE